MGRMSEQAEAITATTPRSVKLLERDLRVLAILARAWAQGPVREAHCWVPHREFDVSLVRMKATLVRLNRVAIRIESAVSTVMEPLISSAQIIESEAGIPMVGALFGPRVGELLRNERGRERLLEAVAKTKTPLR